VSTIFDIDEILSFSCRELLSTKEQSKAVVHDVSVAVNQYVLEVVPKELESANDIDNGYAPGRDPEAAANFDIFCKCCNTCAIVSGIGAPGQIASSRYLTKF
jgi:uncharacterized FAD-dependent dehydrogenase